MRWWRQGGTRIASHPKTWRRSTNLTEAYCQTVSLLSERLGLGHLLPCQQGDALSLPFQPAAFDLVWTEHVAMNIADKARLYSEMYRVLKPGGTLALYDILRTPEGRPVLQPRLSGENDDHRARA